MSPYKEAWQTGEKAWFEYHCLESPESSDAEAWYHSHQRCIVLAEEPSDAWEGSTFKERGEEGQPKLYRVRFNDGIEWAVFEDELMTDPGGFYQPHPPGYSGEKE